MILIDIKTEKILNGVVEKVSLDNLKKLKDDKNFIFNWSMETSNEVYQIRLKDKKVILGLISLTNYPTEFRLHINLIEATNNQKGKQKTIGNIAGCLMAYSCREAFKKGYGGFVSLVPKTKLKPYHQKYGFIDVGLQMAIFGQNSTTLISKYFINEGI